MRVKKVLRISLIVIISLAALIWSVWIIAIPGELVTERVDRALENSPVKARFDGLSKGLFFSVKADAVSVMGSNGGGEIALLEDVRAGLVFTSLFKLSPCGDFSATVASGKIAGVACSDTLDIEAGGVDLSGLSLERSVTGLRAGGTLNAGIHTIGGAGEARFDISGMDFLPYRYMGFSLPLDLLDEAHGLLLIDGNAATVKSVTLEGEGIYARASGTIGGGRVELKLEIMPSEEIEEAQPYFNMLQTYRVAKGLYEIPLRTSY